MSVVEHDEHTSSLTLRNCQSWRPLIPQDVQANGPVRVDVRVVDLGGEADFRRLERIVRRERDGKEEYTARVR